MQRAARLEIISKMFLMPVRVTLGAGEGVQQPVWLCSQTPAEKDPPPPLSFFLVLFQHPVASKQAGSLLPPVNAIVLAPRVYSCRYLAAASWRGAGLRGFDAFLISLLETACVTLGHRECRARSQVLIQRSVNSWEKDPIIRCVEQMNRNELLWTTEQSRSDQHSMEVKHVE